MSFCPEVPESRAKIFFSPKMAILGLKINLAHDSGTSGQKLKNLVRQFFFDMLKDYFGQFSAILAKKCGVQLKLHERVENRN